MSEQPVWLAGPNRSGPVDPQGGNNGAGGPPRVATHRGRTVPVWPLLAYYVGLVVIVGLLAWGIPVVRQAFLAPLDVPAVEGAAVLTGEIPAPRAAGVQGADLDVALTRTLTTLLVVLGALAISLPVAWVYMVTKRLRYDPSLVQSVIILPMVVAGILLVVKNSLALAFSLAGIVAAVRFRNTLKDPKDAVYIFLSLGIGLSSGVQALDIALVVSVVFNVVVLVLWKYDVGAIYGHGRDAAGILAFGEPDLLVARTLEARHSLQEHLAEEAQKMDPDGVLLVHTATPEQARHAVEASLSQAAKEWKLVESGQSPSGLAVMAFLLRMKKKATVVDLLSELDTRWPSQVAAAEFVPFKAVPDEDDDGDD